MKSFTFKTPEYQAKPVPKSAMRAFGIANEGTLNIVDQLVELRKQPPNFVIAESLKNANFSQNNFSEQQLRKKKGGVKPKYVMNIGVYKQLWFDPYRNWKVLRPAPMKFKNIYRPYTGQDLTDKTLLVTRTGGIGDLLFIQPNLIYLKEKYPTCKIKFSCGPQYHAMVEAWDCIDEVLELPFTVQHLTKSHYHAFFEGVIERCKQARHVNAYNLFSKWLGLDLPDELLIPKQKPKQEMVDKCNIFLDNNHIETPFIIIQLRASSVIRTPRPTVWKALIEAIVDKGHQVIITDGPNAANQIDNFINGLNYKCQDSVLNFAHESLTLDYSIALTSLAKLAIATDSSLMHIAASLGTPAFGIYFPFPGEIRLTTYKNVDWISPKNVHCAPCFLHGSQPCTNSIEGHSKCYDTLDIDECVEKIEGLL